MYCCLVCTPFHFPLVVPLLATCTQDFQLDSSVPARSNDSKSGTPNPGSTTCTAQRLRHAGEVTPDPTHTDRHHRGTKQARTLATHHPKIFCNERSIRTHRSTVFLKRSNCGRRVLSDNEAGFRALCEPFLPIKVIRVSNGVSRVWVVSLPSSSADIAVHGIVHAQLPLDANQIFCHTLGIAHR